MTQDKNSRPEGASDQRSNRPNTIDLKATEFKSETAAAETQASPETARATSEDAPSRDAAGDHETFAQDPAARETPAQDTPAAARQGLPWAVIGIAAGASALFFIIGFAASQWLAGRMSTPVTVAPAQFAPSPELQARLSKIESAIAAPRRDDPQLLARVAAAEAAVKTATDMAAARERRSDEIAALAREARDRAASAMAAAEAAQKANPGTPEARAEIDTLMSRIATLEQSARALEQSARASETELKRRASEPVDDARGRLAIASMALRNAVESGAPFASELATAKALSADARAVATLEPFAAGGVPTATALGRELESLMPAIWKAARTEETPQGSFLERLQANAQKIVRIRPAGDVAGDEPDNVKARIEVRAENADIRGALTELAKLPPAARAPAQAWIARAEARDAAISAARELSRNALNALAKSGS